MGKDPASVLAEVPGIELATSIEELERSPVKHFCKCCSSPARLARPNVRRYLCSCGKFYTYPGRGEVRSFLRESADSRHQGTAFGYGVFLPQVGPRDLQQSQVSKVFKFAFTMRASHHRKKVVVIGMIPSTYFPLNSSQSRAAASVDHVEHLLALGRPRQVLVSVLGDEDVVFNSHSAHVPILVQHLLVDVLGVDGVPEEVALNVLAAEVAGKSVSLTQR